MTTTITLHVNGRYRAKVKQDDKDWVTVEGNYEGSPNPEGKHTFNLVHATSNKFVVNEEPIDPPAQDAHVEGKTIEVGVDSGPKVIDATKPGAPEVQTDASNLSVDFDHKG